VSWSYLGTVTVPRGAALAGLAVTSHDTTVTNTASFDNVAVMTTLPAGWMLSDIGAVGQAGSASASNGTFTISGAGSDIWGSADSFTAVTQPCAGDGTIVGRVVSEQNTHPFAKAGVIVGGLAATSARVIIDVKPDATIEFMARSADGQTMSFIAGAGASFPVWLKLSRGGDQVTGSISADGTAWTTVGSVGVTMASNVFAGMAVTSHDPSVLNTAVFDQVAAGPPAPTSGDIVVYANDIPDSAMHGVWTRASDPTSPQGVKLATADNGVASSAMASPADYVDVTFNAAAGTPYTLWLRVQALANSKFNDSVWVQFSDAMAGGAAVFPIGSTDALLVNLATDSTATSLNGWGWQNTAYWLSQPTTVTFAAAGPHTLRIQVREDGVQLDQIVLSPSRFRAAAPGGVTNDGTIVPK